MIAPKTSVPLFSEWKSTNVNLIAKQLTAVFELDVANDYDFLFQPHKHTFRRQTI